MSNMYVDVATFVSACGQHPSEKNAELYKNLMKEEWDEFWQAAAVKDDLGELDGCMDLIWVILGYCRMRGWDVHGAWHEIALNNLSKINPDTGQVKKDENGKVMKPNGWTPPDMKRYI
jgi:predicted HAD superfamily Cof-like phosphohydrolase